MSFIEDVRRKMPSLISTDEFIEKYGIALRNADGELRSTNEIFADSLRAFEAAESAMDDFVEASEAHHFLDGVASTDEFGKDRWERYTQDVFEFDTDANLRDLRISTSSSDCVPEFAEFCGSYTGDSNAFGRTYVGRPYVNNNKGGVVMGIPTSVGGVNDKWLRFVNGSGFTFIERPDSIDDWATVEPNTRPYLVAPRGRTFSYNRLIDVLAEQGLENAVAPNLLQKCLEKIKMESDESVKSASDVDTSMLDDFIKSYERTDKK